MRILIATLAAVTMAAIPAAATAQPDEDPIANLKEGGFILVMRHANSPYDQQASVGMTEGCILAEGRGLDAIGYFQARALGEFLRAEGVPLLKAYTSDMCRSYDTAMIVSAGAPVIPHPAQKTTDPTQIAQFKKEIEAELIANSGQNIALSNHSNIAPLYGATLKGGEEEIPSGVIFVVDPEDWRAIARIVIDTQSISETVTVE